MIARPATADDLPDIMRMSRAMHASGQYAAVSLDMARWERFVAGCIGAADGCVFVSGDRPVGMIVAGVSEYPWSGSRMASDAGFWVDPEARNGRNAVALVKAYEAHAQARGAVHGYLGTTNMVDYGRAARFYGILGYEKVGEVYRKVLT